MQTNHGCEPRGQAGVCRNTSTFPASRTFPMPDTRPLRLAIDIGGTFTDTVLSDGGDRPLSATKTLTTHENPALGALEGAQHVIGLEDALKANAEGE